MKTNTTNKVVVVVWLVVATTGLWWSASGGLYGMEDLANVKEYPPERLARFCEKLREVRRMQRERDLLGQLEMLKDRDPWVRDIVYYALRNDVVRTICKDPPFRRFDPWGKPDEIEKQVAAFKECVRENKDKLPRPAKRSEERIRRMENLLKDDVRLLRELVLMARHRLDQGDKRGVYPLKALLDYPDERTQRWALTWLILKANAEFFPNDGQGVYKRLADPEVLKQKKKEWLAWWKENEETFKPKREPMGK